MDTGYPNVVSSVARQRAAYVVVALGFGALVFEGYDLIVYGAAVPALLAYQAWHLTAAKVGAIGGSALFGMFLGAPLAGWLSDRFGRRRMFIALLTFFSLMMIPGSGCAYARAVHTFSVSGGSWVRGNPADRHCAGL